MPLLYWLVRILHPPQVARLPRTIGPLQHLREMELFLLGLVLLKEDNDDYMSVLNKVMGCLSVSPKAIFQDVKDVKYVINYDYPGSLEDYAHRIGHTGRVVAKGTACTFFTAANARFGKELVTIVEEAGQKVSPELAAMVAIGIM